MASFGESLRREREMRGVTLEEISATTKINLRLLQALEAEDFAKLPGGLFTRSFLRAYAGYLGLDAERILAEYQLVAPPTPEVVSKAHVTPLVPGRRAALTRFVPWLVAISLLTAGYALYRYSHRIPEIAGGVPVTAPISSPPVSTAQNAAANPSPQGAPPGVPTANTIDAARPSTQPSQVGEGLTGAEKSSSGGQPNLPASGSSYQPQTLRNTSALPETAIPRSGNAPGNQGRPPSAIPPSPTAKGADGNLVLEVTTTERAWVAVDADGKTIFQSTLNPNEAKTFTAKDSFEVFTGNAQGTVLTLNGTKQKFLGREGEVKRIRLTRNSLPQLAH
jgi:cytoskeleton protein RodZ